MSRPLPFALLRARDQPALARRLERDGTLHRVRPGVYAPAADWRGLSPWDRYLVRVHAVAQTWSEPVFCLESAAVLQGLPVFGEPRHIHLLSANGTTWRQGDVWVHGSRDARAIVTREGLRLTAPEETTLDLCRVLPPAFALAVADSALRSLHTLGRTLDLGERGRQQSNRRGLRQLDWLQARATHVAESPGESVSRAAIEWLGYEEPELQTTFEREGVVDRADFYWRARRVIGESDGYGKYDADDPETMKAHFVREKLREDRLRRYEAGFIRWDWSDVVGGSGLDEKLRLGGLARIRPVQMSLLATLTGPHPRSVALSRRTRGRAPNQRS